MIYVIGQDFKIHQAETHIREDLAACTRIVALRRCTPSETSLAHWQDRLCAECFPENQVVLNKHDPQTGTP